MKKVLLGALLLCGLAQPQGKVIGPVVLFLGPPGSGKSTQAAAAAKTLNLPVVSATALMEASHAASTSDPALNRLFTERLNKGDLTRGVILDGYPSTKEHVDYLSKFVKDGTLSRPLAIILQLQDIDAMKRADNAPDIQQRLKDYHREANAVRLNFMNLETILIDAAQPAAAIEKQVNNVLKARYK